MNFTPFSAQTKTLPISVTTTASTSAALPGQGPTVRLINEGTVAAFVSIGSGTQIATLPNATATVTSVPVLAGTDITLGIPSDAIYNISAITRTGTTTLHAEVGDSQ